ncbi:hypothetical protein DUD61_003215 [Geotrichum candidum]|nr:hypothetical protein DUD61_003215 [Geotrichum candidum]
MAIAPNVSRSSSFAGAAALLENAEDGAAAGLYQPSRTKYHPLHSNTNSIDSIADDPTLTPATMANRPSSISNEESSNSGSSSGIDGSVASSQNSLPFVAPIITRRSSHKLQGRISSPKLTLVPTKQATQATKSTLPALSTAVVVSSSGPESPVSSVNRYSIRSNSTDAHSLSGDRGNSSNNFANLRAILTSLKEASEPPGASAQHLHEKPIVHPQDEPIDDSRNSLFDDINFNSAPGNLHLLSDAALERFVTRYGTVNVVRQLATDLAQREAELILIRRQQEDRERELKKMLGQCGVSMADVDKALRNATVRKPREVLDELMSQAMNDESNIGSADPPVSAPTTVTAPSNIPAAKSDHKHISRQSRSDSGASTSLSNARSNKQKSWTGFFLGGSEDIPRRKNPAESVTSEGDGDSLYSTEIYPQAERDNTSIHSESSHYKNLLSTARPRSSSQAFEWIPKSIKDHVPGSGPSTVTSNDKRPLELDNIVPQNIQPPTLLPSWNNYYGVHDQYLTDRFGFIYDRHKDSKSIKNHPLTEEEDEDEEPSAPAPAAKAPQQEPDRPRHALVKIVNENSRSQIHIVKPSQFEPEVVTQNATAFPLTHELTLDSSTPLTTINDTNDDKTNDNDTRPQQHNSVRMLLAQLTDMHDTIQKTQTSHWNDFLEKLNTIADFTSSVQNGTELIGVSGTGLANTTYYMTGHGSGSSGGGGGSSVTETIDNAVLTSLKKLTSQQQQLWKEFKTLVLGGVPIAYRAKIWSECSGARSLKTPGVYQSLVSREETENEHESINQIDLDLYRTMPYNVFFGSKGPGVHKLRRVLIAFSRRNPEVGYCQGMNLITAMLLLVFATEEEAFWLLVSLVENILPAGYFSPPLLTSRADQTVFNQLFTALLPTLWAHLADVGVQVEAITFDWFLSCFTDALPPDVLFRVWDVFLCSEGEVYLFRVALALFKLFEADLLKLGSASEVYSFMKQLNYRPIGVEALIREADSFKPQVVDTDVKNRRQLEVERLLEELRIV